MQAVQRAPPSYLLLGSRELLLNVAGHFARSQPLPQIQLSHLEALLYAVLDAGCELIEAMTTGRTARATFELESSMSGGEMIGDQCNEADEML